MCWLCGRLHVVWPPSQLSTQPTLFSTSHSPSLSSSCFRPGYDVDELTARDESKLLDSQICSASWSRCLQPRLLSSSLSPFSVSASPSRGPSVPCFVFSFSLFFFRGEDGFVCLCLFLSVSVFVSSACLCVLWCVCVVSGCPAVWLSLIFVFFFFSSVVPSIPSSAVTIDSLSRNT